MTITELVKKRIEELQNDNDFIVLKGFPIPLLKELRTQSKFINDNYLTDDDKYDLKKINDNLNEFLQALLGSDGGLIEFEPFIHLSANFNIEVFFQKKKFIILENNIFDYYPNQSNIIPVDYEKQIIENENIEADEYFTKFYSEAYKIFDKNYVKYIDGLYDEYQNVSIKYLIEGVEDQKTEARKISDTSELPKHYVVFNIDNNDFIKFKEDLFYGKETNIEGILIDKNDNYSSFKKVNELAYLIKKLGLTITFYELDSKIKDSYRNELNDLLKRFWGSKKNPNPVFRELQIYSDPDISKEIISISQGVIVEEVINQYEKAQNSESYSDIFLTAPTGAGKSLLFQLPAIYLSETKGAVTIVISPLIALMKDQVSAMKEERNFDGVAYINSELSLTEREEIIEKIQNGQISIVYLSPELLLSYDLSMFIGNRTLGLLVIDEAHLVTTWGRDFRVDYWYLGQYVNKIRKYYEHKFIIMSVTATAIYQGEHDMVFDTINSLNMNNPILYIGKVRRDDISFDINQIEIPKEAGGHEQFKTELTASRIEEFIKNNKKTIVYCPWTNQIENIRLKLDANIRNRVGVYWGGLDQYEKNDTQISFKNGNISTIIATKAFGMGVDIDDVTVVYHHAPSGHLTDYVQEIGRLARRKDLTGVAKTDFNKKDLKFTKILYGLSSIKQYQVRMVLDKLNKIYSFKRERNLLVSVNDFEYIFNFENIDVEQKVKSALLLLEKDLLNKYRFNVLIVRPKSLFTTVFLKVKSQEDEIFNNLFKDISEYVYNERTEVLSDINRQGKIYKFQLDKLWESRYRNESFPVIKKKFFDKELFTDFGLEILPQIKLDIVLNEPEYETFKKIEYYFNVIHEVLNGFRGFFSKQQLISGLNIKLNNRTLSHRIANLFLSIYSSDIDFSKKYLKLRQPESFIQKRRKGNDIEYRIIDKAYTKVKATMRRRFKENVFKNKDQNQTIFLSATKKSLEKNKGIIRLAYMIETFNLGTYELSGGELPSIFIRINDPLKLNKLAKKDYTNLILKRIEQKQENSVKIMEDFFMSNDNDVNRWDFIEDYFLGRNED